MTFGFIRKYDQKQNEIDRLVLDETLTMLKFTPPIFHFF